MLTASGHLIAMKYFLTFLVFFKCSFVLNTNLQPLKPPEIINHLLWFCSSFAQVKQRHLAIFSSYLATCPIAFNIPQWTAHSVQMRKVGLDIP